MNKKIATGIIITIILAVGYFIFSNSKGETDSALQEKEASEQNNQSSSVPQIVNKQASFAIFTNGTFRVFTAAMYHNLSEDVYIEARTPNFVKVKTEGVTWNDFFSTLPLTLAKNCLTTGTKETFCTGQNGSLRFYLNGDLDQDALNKEIKAGDQLLVTFGKDDAKQTQEQIQQLRKL